MTIGVWDCPNCGAHYDRDINAAKNILVGRLKQPSSIYNPPSERGLAC
ncbi:zinc ribbon domain-containing protein [Sporolactobacillus putidus]